MSILDCDTFSNRFPKLSYVISVHTRISKGEVMLIFVSIPIFILSAPQNMTRCLV